MLDISYDREGKKTVDIFVGKPENYNIKMDIRNIRHEDEMNMTYFGLCPVTSLAISCFELS
jgi:hypothetical protein